MGSLNTDHVRSTREGIGFVFCVILFTKEDTSYPDPAQEEGMSCSGLAPEEGTSCPDAA